MEAGRRSRGAGARRGRSPHRPLALTCFRPIDSSFSPKDCLRLDRSPANGVRTYAAPTHLVVMVNGIIGNAGDWRFAAKHLVKKFPEDVIVLRSRCNYHTLTFDGVDVMGERLAKEVLEVTKVLPGLKKISFLGHSLGGLIARYAIARLYSSCRESSESESCSSSDIDTHGSEESRGKIAGLEPINFITFATPHLGSRWHKQIPLLGGSRALEKVAVKASWILGRTGRHLFLNDKNAPVPLLFQMTNDTADLKFISALECFHRRVAYANARFDYIVGWRTSSIRRKTDCPKNEHFVKNDMYPHVIHVETPEKQGTDKEIVEERKVCLTDMEEEMIESLNRVSWERVDVSFRKSNQRIFAHNTILVSTYLLHSDGVDVINHMIDHLVL